MTLWRAAAQPGSTEELPEPPPHRPQQVDGKFQSAVRA